MRKIIIHQQDAFALILYVDSNQNGVFDDGVISVLAGKTVFLDSNGDGVWQHPERRAITDSTGKYSFANLGNQEVTVVAELDSSTLQTSPRGSVFDRREQPLSNNATAFANPQSVVTGLFNNDAFPDVVVALGEGNLISIRLNDGHGGFLDDKIDIAVPGSGAGPVALQVGQFNNNAATDLAVVNNFNSTVTIMLDFNGTDFESKTSILVGTEPIDIASGLFNDDAFVDLAVVNKGSNSVSVLLNDGNGSFSVGSTFSSGGRFPTSIVAGQFTDDNADGVVNASDTADLAILNSLPTNTGINGIVNILKGSMSGAFSSIGQYTVGATPLDMVAADFDLNGVPDLAVNNFSSNSITILTGSSSGVFEVQSEVLGTAKGSIEIAIIDIEGDGDFDLVSSNLADQNVSIFRNTRSQSPLGAPLKFEPAENVGVGQFTLAKRMPLTVTDFDLSGTDDIVTVPQVSRSIIVLRNSLVKGSHRVAVNGTETVRGLDFGTVPAKLPPSFNGIANPLPILEDATPQSIIIGGITKGRETGPALRFTVTSDNSLLIPSPGQIPFAGGTTASFSYAPVAHANGITTLTVRAIDAGADGSFGGSDDGIFERSFTVSVLAVNDPPVFVMPAQASAKQTDGATAIADFITGPGKGGGSDENSQTLSAFTVTADASFFTVPPAIDATGQLTFTPNPDKSGAVPVTVSLSDNGGRANGGVDTTTKTFVLNLLPVNDRPSITIGNNQTVQAGAGAASVNNFATGFQPGGGSDEAAQTISGFVVTTDQSGLFAVQPAIDISGKLTFTPAADRSGLATVNVQVRDSGGRANGGEDLSIAQKFTILITPAAISYAIAATSAIKAEGQSSSVPTPYTFTVTRTGLTSVIGTVDYAVTGSGSNPATAADFANSVLPSGTVSFAAGVTSQVVTINVAGDALVELNEGFKVTLSNPSQSASIATASATGAIQNDDTAFAIAATQGTRPEGQVIGGATPFTFTVTRSGLTTGTSTVGYKITASTLNPVSAADFVGGVVPTGTLTFGPGVTSQIITVNIAGDVLVENDERFIVTLQTPSTGTSITTATALGIIQNDDLSYAISSSTVSKPEGHTGTTVFAYTVARSGLSTVTSTVEYEVIPSSQNPVTAADFAGGVFPSGTLTFAPGEFRKTLEILVAGDSLVELDERFVVRLLAPNGAATITKASTLGEILNDDTSFAIAATSASKSEGRSLTTPFTFTVTRGGLTTGTSTVQYVVSGSGSSPATATDFIGGVFPSGTLTLGPGVKSLVVSVPVAGDSLVESNESFLVTLQSPSAPASLRVASASGTILNDDSSFAIAATSATKPEGQSGSTSFTFTVTRSGITSGIATVNYAVTASTTNPASASDFAGGVLPSGTLIFGSGVTTQVIVIAVRGDTTAEKDERFVVTLSDASSPLTITVAGALGVIQNDD